MMMEKPYPSALKEFYLLKARCINQRNESFWLDWDLSEGAEMITDPDGDVTDFENIAKYYADYLHNQEGYVVSYKEQLKKQPVPLCFSTDSLRYLASSLFEYDDDEIIGAALSLYEQHKAITNPITDCEYVPEVQFLEINAVLDALTLIDASLISLVNKGNRTQKSRVWNDKIVSAHHGIIPTNNPNVQLTKMTIQERRIYDLIRRSYITQFFNEYEYLEKHAFCMIYDEPFDATCFCPKEKGWKEVFSDDEEEQSKDGELPRLFDNEPILCEEVRIDKHYKVLWSNENG
ncbi:DNA topoisomerase [uncultured Legionella sp.]|uniref:DNA topoisomerase n=1 Tax=uncultured Legionella sp. TaxID=210934 RepID=UPI00262DA6CD|nr:DNA topoisomerase [uncultured Legionella sp.]